MPNTDTREKDDRSASYYSPWESACTPKSPPGSCDGRRMSDQPREPLGCGCLCCHSQSPAPASHLDAWRHRNWDCHLLQSQVLRSSKQNASKMQPNWCLASQARHEQASFHTKKATSYLRLKATSFSSKFTRCSCQVSKLQPSNLESGTLPTELSWLCASFYSVYIPPLCYCNGT